MGDVQLDHEALELLLWIVDTEATVGRGTAFMVLRMAEDSALRFVHHQETKSTPQPFIDDLLAAGLIRKQSGDLYNVTPKGRDFVDVWSDAPEEGGEQGDWIGTNAAKVEEVIAYLEEWLRDHPGTAQETADSIRTTIQALRQELRTPPARRHPGVWRHFCHLAGTYGIPAALNAATQIGTHYLENPGQLPHP